MVVQYDDETGGFTVFDESQCPSCGNPELYDSGCDAPGCQGWSCQECGWGCDLDFAGENGACASAIAAEDPDDREARYDRERAVWGLPPVGTAPNAGSAS